jgi:hypothetical protein
MNRSWLIATGLTLLIAAATGACEPALDATSCPGDAGIPADAAWPPASMVHAAGTVIVDGDGAPLSLRCVNVDAWLLPIPYLVSDASKALLTSPSEFAARLDAVVGAPRAAEFWRQWRDAFITEADFARIHALGFNCARLVVYHRAIATVTGDQATLDEARVAHVDAAVAWAKAQRLYLVLDLHTAPGGQNALPTVADVPSSDPVARLWEGPTAAANQRATVALWRALAERYKDETVIAGFDLLNEPSLPDGVAPSALVDLYRRLIAAVREVDPRHLVFVEGDALAHDFSMFDAPLDANLAYEFHAYALTGLEAWATPELADLQPYLDLRAAHDRPLWLGEFGEQTLEWQTQMTALMDQHDIGWALYPWKRKQTLFWNPVPQRIPDMPKWYAVAAYLARSPGGSTQPPSAADAEAGMAEALSVIGVERCAEDLALVRSVLCH